MRAVAGEQPRCNRERRNFISSMIYRAKNHTSGISLIDTCMNYNRDALCARRADYDMCYILPAARRCAELRTNREKRLHDAVFFCRVYLGAKKFREPRRDGRLDISSHYKRQTWPPAISVAAAMRTPHAALTIPYTRSLIRT